MEAMERTGAPHSSVSVGCLMSRVRGEYSEMPGLRLTLPQAQRLFGLESAACAVIFESLTRDNFLCRGRDGRFCVAGPFVQS
jgi:hypothetical protein